MPCWQTCWTPLSGRPVAGTKAHCTATCPPIAEAEPAIEWRRRWDRELAAFVQTNEQARSLARATEFIRPLVDTNFMWGVY